VAFGFRAHFATEHKKARIEAFVESNKPKLATRKSAKEPMSNITDNESAKIISSHGVIQGCSTWEFTIFQKLPIRSKK